MVGGMISGIGQAGIGIADWIKGVKDFKKYKGETETALAQLPQYQTSQYAKQQLAGAQSQTNAINPAVQMMYDQAQKQAANTAAMGQRNAMSGAEAINAALMGQQIAQNQMPQLAQAQTEYQLANQNRLDRALGAMTQEDQNVFNSKNAIRNQLLNYKMGLMGAGAQRRSSGQSNAIGGLSAWGESLDNAMAQISGMATGMPTGGSKSGGVKSNLGGKNGSDTLIF